MRFISIAAPLCLCVSSAMADVSTFTDYGDWASAPADFDLYPGLSVTQITGDLAGATTAKGSIFGGSGWNSWSLAASTGDLNRDGTIVSVAVSGASLVFTFAGTDGGTELRGIGGDFGIRDEFGNFAPARLIVTLSDGSAINKSPSGSFAGFWTTEPDSYITGLTISPVAGSGFMPVDAHAAVSSIAFGGVAVPSPGALALLASAGMIGARRRR